MDGAKFPLGHGSLVIAAITSCTNTSNPSVLIAAGLLAKKGGRARLTVKPWVKTSLAPGSKVVTAYLKRAGLTTYLDQLHFNLVGYGCTTCIGNSGPVAEPIAGAVKTGNLVASAILSGNRNFEGRINPVVRFNYLASPPLVVAYAIAGTMDIDPNVEPLTRDATGNAVFLRDLWPSAEEITAAMAGAVDSAMFKAEYGSVFEGDDRWRGLKVPDGDLFRWEEQLIVREGAAVLRWGRSNARAGGRYQGRASARDARRQRHHRSHLAGRIDRRRWPGRPLPGRQRRVAA